MDNEINSLSTTDNPSQRTTNHPECILAQLKLGNIYMSKRPKVFVLFGGFLPTGCSDWTETFCIQSGTACE